MIEHHSHCQIARGRGPLKSVPPRCTCPRSWPLFLELRQQCRYVQLPIPQPEFRFLAGRKFEFDAAWSLAPVHPIKLALEIDGGVFSPGGGRHNRGAGYRTDQEKFAEATILGWSVFRCLPEDIKSGKALAWIERFFAARGLVSHPPQRSLPGVHHP